MNFTFTWILDKFGFQPKIETFDFPVKPEVKKAVAKKVAKKAVKIPKATTRTSKTKK
jgi:predicted subunit of tRNA(5-methylaminomethyl-2-thiouridylate) methyltransferase